MNATESSVPNLHFFMIALSDLDARSTEAALTNVEQSALLRFCGPGGWGGGGEKEKRRISDNMKYNAI